MEINKINVCTEAPSKEGELFKYGFGVDRNPDGEFEVVERLFVSNGYKVDQEIRDCINKLINEACLSSAIKKQFITFGIESDLNADPSLEVIKEAASNAVKAVINCLSGDK